MQFVISLFGIILYSIKVYSSISLGVYRSFIFCDDLSFERVLSLFSFLSISHTVQRNIHITIIHKKSGKNSNNTMWWNCGEFSTSAVICIKWARNAHFLSAKNYIDNIIYFKYLSVKERITHFVFNFQCSEVMRNATINVSCIV